MQRGARHIYTWGVTALIVVVLAVISGDGSAHIARNTCRGHRLGCVKPSRSPHPTPTPTPSVTPSTSPSPSISPSPSVSPSTSIPPYTGCPPTAVQLAAGSSLSSAASSHPTGTVFCLADGSYSGGVVPLGSQQFWAAHYRAAIVDGNYTQSTAFSGSASGVQLHGLVVKRFKPTRTNGAVTGGSGWTIADCQITANGDWFVNSSNLGGAGIFLGSGWTVTGNLLDHNGEEGFGMGGSGQVVTFTNNEVAWNNVSHQDWSYEAGGGKFWSSGPGTLISGNYVHDNDGPGLWIDSSSGYAANGYTISNNVVNDNNGPGIDVEVSGAGSVTNNTTRHNGAYHSNSPFYGSSEISIEQVNGATVTGNKMYGGAGLTVLDEGRSGYPCACNLHASGNTTTHETFTNSFVTSANFPTLTGLFGNTFTTNSWQSDTYVGIGINAWFRNPGSLTFAQWQAAGQDTLGSAT